MRIDMHVYTKRYSNCSRMTPEEMAKVALDSGLDAVVITEHDVQWSEAEVQALQINFPSLVILRGIEVSILEGHALVYGVPDKIASTFYRDMPITDLTSIVHQTGGIVVLAHPARYEDHIPDAVYDAGIDGVEIMSSNIRRHMAPYITELRTRLDLPALANSDGHVTDSLGVYAMDFRVPIHNELDLVRAVLREQFSVVCDREHVAVINGDLTSQISTMQQLIRENTLTREEIKARYHFSFAFQKGVRENKDMHLREHC